MSCGKTSASPTVGSKDCLQRDLKALLFGASAMIGEVKAFLDDGVDIDGPVLARAFARVQQHVLDDRNQRACRAAQPFRDCPALCIRQFVNLSALLYR